MDANCSLGLIIICMLDEPDEIFQLCNCVLDSLEKIRDSFLVFGHRLLVKNLLGEFCLPLLHGYYFIDWSIFFIRFCS